MPGPAKGTRPSGRKKGVPNKKTFDLQAKLESLNCDPIEGLAKICKDPKTLPQLRAEIYLDLMGYLYAKRKAIEVSGQDGSPIEHSHSIQFTDPAVARAASSFAVALALQSSGDGAEAIQGTVPTGSSPPASL
jgi:hypothetical protein